MNAGESVIAGNNGIDEEKRIMLFGGADIPYGKPVQPFSIMEGDPTRLYCLDEIRGIMEDNVYTRSGK